MRVLLVVESLTIGGLPNYVLELARGLADAGETVAVAHGTPEIPPHLDVSGVTLLTLDSAVLNNTPLARAQLQSWAPDIVHIHLCSHPHLLEALRGLDAPIARSFHDYTSMCLRRGRRRFPGDRCQRALGPGCLMFGCSVGAPNPGQRLFRVQSLSAKQHELSVYQSFDAAIGGSQYLRQTLLVNGFAPEKVHVVPYFSRFDGQAEGRIPMVPKPTGIPGVHRPMQMLFAGQAVAGKGLTVAIRAMVDLPGKWHFTAITAGPEVAKAQALVARHGLQDCVTLRDWLPQAALADLYRQSDVFLVPSVWDDPGPLVGIEALSFGTPVVAFPVGGLPDYVRNDETGWLASEVSVAAFHQALRQALTAGPRLSLIGDKGRAMIARQHARVVHIAHLQQIYRRLLLPAAELQVPGAAATMHRAPEGAFKEVRP